MKPYVKAFLFLAVVTVFEYAFRKGIVPIPIPLPPGYAPLLLFTLFALFAWLATKWFSRSDELKPRDFGISFSKGNQRDFFIGLIVGIGIWAVVSLIQSTSAGFDWVLRTDISMYNILFGLVFIFIADLGTEIYTRGYPLTKLSESFGPIIAIAIMALFTAIRSYSFGLDSEILMYVILIPAIHVVFFSFIYFKTKRLGGALGVHTGANFVTNSIFDLRETHEGQVIPSGIFEANMPLENLSLTALQLPYVIVGVLFSAVCYLWWKKDIV